MRQPKLIIHRGNTRERGVGSNNNNNKSVQIFTGMAPTLVFTIFSIAALAWSCAGAVPSVPAIFVFGDSLADVGNNNYLNTSTAKANFPPNGIDFPGRTPTGRFSNGYNGIDWLAKLLGYERSPPAFLSLTNGTQMLKGVNFASAGSGILDTTGSTLTFTAQIADFKSVVDDLAKQMGEEKAANFLSKSLFIISAGSNDVFRYYVALGPHTSAQNTQFVNSLTDEFREHLKVLYEHGARKFVVIGMSHIGCTPTMRSRNPLGQCDESLNGLARMFNVAAKEKMHHLESTLKGMKYSYGNVYNLMTLALEKPQMFGYKNIRSACCGSGKFNGESPCTPTATLCLNRDQYLFWDQAHPTQATSRFTAQMMYGGSRRFAIPVNVKTLAKC